MKMAGLTELAIAISILETLGLMASEKNLQKLLSLYKKILPLVCIAPKDILLMGIDGVKEILDCLQQCEQVVSILLTGNCETGAWAKLAHYGLDHYFNLGSFGENHCERTELAKVALTIAQQEVENLNLDRCYVIGDTPYDIRCGQAIGVKTIALANQHYGVAELASHNSSLVWEKFPTPPSFMAQLCLRA